MNRLECLELLVLNGADIKRVNGDEQTLLDVAVDSKRKGIIAYIVAKIEGQM